MVGKLMWTEFFANKDWPLASALALAMLILLVVPFIAMQRLHQRFEEDEE
jgi:putrescine transport system permease protein